MNITETHSLSAHQAKALHTLEAVIDLCEKNGIDYFLAGGTLLGAMRHKGFVPWDDDIDICVPRPHYERLLAAASEIEAPYEILHAGNDPEFIYPYAKAYDSSTTVVENFQKPFTRGVWVDIFPLDGTFSNKYLRKTQFTLIRKLISILVDQQQYYKPPQTLAKSLRKKAKTKLFSLIPKSSIIRSINFLCGLKSYSEAKFATLLIGKWGNKESAPMAFFSSHQLLKFEHLTAKAPAGADPWLRQVFGDYMTPPPAAERIPTHAIKHVDLSMPYREFLDKS